VQKRFLAPWHEAREALPEEASTLERLVADNPEQQARAQRIIQATTSYLGDYSIPLVTAARHDPTSARTLAATDEGRRRVDAMRVDFDDFIGTERRLAEAQQVRSDDAARRAVLAAVGGLVVSTLLVLVFAGYLSRAIVQPVRRAGRMAVRLAGGNLSTRMPATGVAEIGQLERAFNQMAGSLERNRDELARLAAEQAALRQVATLVARGVAPDFVLAAVAQEAGQLLGADLTTIFRFEPDRTAMLMGGRGWRQADLRLGVRWKPEPPSVVASVLETGRSARSDEDDQASASLRDVVRREGIRSGVGSPIIVEGNRGA
jgi:HAMP domain-containing protein